MMTNVQMEPMTVMKMRLVQIQTARLNVNVMRVTQIPEVLEKANAKVSTIEMC